MTQTSDQMVFQPREIGLFGLGAFGRLIVKHLSPYFRIKAYDPSKAALRFARRHNIEITTPEIVAACPMVILATPVPVLEAVAKSIAPHIRKGAMVFDVGSVKTKPARWLKAALPQHCDIICTHPLFGPQSAKTGIVGLEVVLCPVRAPRLYRISAFLERTLQLKVTVTTPEAHDEALAAVQGLTHLIAKVMSGLEPLPRRHTTASYDLMMKGIGYVQGDSDELFLTIERDNPFAADVRRRFFEEIDALRLRLDEAHGK